MITGVVGLTGSGKSTLLAHFADRAQRGKRLTVGLPLFGGCVIQDLRSKDYERIYSNMPLRGCYPLTWDMLGKYEIRNALILWDEIIMDSDSRHFKEYPEEVKFFMSQHRKFDIDFIWCTQNYRDVDLRIRNLTQQYLKLEKVGGSSRVIPVYHDCGVRNGSFDDWYEYGPPLSRMRLHRRKLYHMFDTRATAGRVLEPLPPLTMWDVDGVAEQKKDLIPVISDTGYTLFECVVPDNSGKLVLPDKPVLQY